MSYVELFIFSSMRERLELGGKSMGFGVRVQRVTLLDACHILTWAVTAMLSTLP